MNKSDYTYVLIWAKKIKAINLLGGKCECCGENDIFKLCFHHKDPSKKEFKINDFKHYRWSKIKDEVLKCQLLCHNCHNELHFNDNETQSKKNKKTYLSFKNVFKCEECGYDKQYSVLQFHHKDPNEKDFSFRTIRKKYNTIHDLCETMITELDKCRVLCNNCHRLEHVDIDKFNEFKNEIYKRVDNYREKQKPLDRDVVIKMYNNGMKQKDIVEYFGCAKSTISMIIKKSK